MCLFAVAHCYKFIDGQKGLDSTTKFDKDLLECQALCDADDDCYGFRSRADECDINTKAVPTMDVCSSAPCGYYRKVPCGE